MKKINDIVVLGGGTAGLISSLMLKTKFPQKNIKIIKSSEIGIVGVGESSTEHWAKFCKYVGIPQLAYILECNATFKIGVYFENWADNDFMHNIGVPYTHLDGDYYKVYAHLIANNCPPSKLSSRKTWKNELNISHFSNSNQSPSNQYHFDTFALNEFLHKECTKRGIDIIVDDVNSVTIDDNTEEILSIGSEKKRIFCRFLH